VIEFCYNNSNLRQDAAICTGNPAKQVGWAAQKLYESEITFSPKIFPYNADVIAVWANDIGPLQISNRYYLRLMLNA
jgi:hypothetical protein